ncbi:MAG: carbon storage regulator [Sedimentisphaerales bacterium]|nr:carbon storage regulator [Sedimentisphaerales bacterium]
MLILSRRCGQSIMIGDDIEVFVVDIGGGKVRLGIAGPMHVPVHQRERYDARWRGGLAESTATAQVRRSESAHVS